MPEQKLIREIPESPRGRLVPCGDFDPTGCEVYDPDCQVCQSANSDAPEWTL